MTAKKALRHILGSTIVLLFNVSVPFVLYFRDSQLELALVFSVIALLSSYYHLPIIFCLIKFLLTRK